MPSELREQLQTTLGDSYTLERELGGGGMSRVFVALDNGLNRRVVVKVLPQDMSASVSIERFKREIALAARLQHPHIVPLLNAGATDGLPYFTMPYVEGESLRARLARGGELPVAEGVRILREVASALDYAHEKGVVHRDIKPDNVLLSRGSAVVSDFGVAKALSASSNAEESGMTSLGVALGTPAYMSPEQAAANPNIDARADIYAFGVMAYELFAGRPPFAGRSPQAMLAAHVAEQPEHIQKLRPVLPPALATLVMRCLEKHPADRPQTAAEIMHALDAITTPSGGSQPTAAVPAVAQTSAIRPILITAAGLVIVVALAYGAIKLRDGSSNAPIRSIAVMPFENTGGDTAGAYFADGMRDEIATALGKLPAISVASRTSSYAFRGKTVTPQEIGKQLGVDAILEGTVRRSGDQLRVSAQLTRASTGLGLWSDSYNRRMTDVFAVQDELAKAIAARLGEAVGRGRASEILSVAKTRGTEHEAAYDLYLRGRYLLNARADLPRAIGYFESAARLDTNFAQAYAAAATTYSLIPFYEGVDATEVLPRVQSAARRALRLDSTLAEAHAAIANAFAYTFSWKDAEHEFQVALALDSTSSVTYALYGYVLGGIGRIDDARRALERAVRLDPLNANTNVNFAYALIANGQVDSSIAIARRLRDVDSASRVSWRIVARAHRAKGDYAAAAAEFERANDPASWKERVPVYVQLGRRREADSLRAALEQRAGARGRYADVFAAYLALGDKPNALRWLERAIDRHDGGILSLRLFDSPDMKPARDDPDFRRLIDRLGVNR